MEDNRFLRVYREYKGQEREKEQSQEDGTNRFSCLRESSQDCRVNSNIDMQTNKFSCLVDDNYINQRYSPRSAPYSPSYSPRSAPYSPKQEPYSPRSAPYSPRQESYSYASRESVNTISRRMAEERRLKPKLSFDSEYHFPDLSPQTTKSRGMSLDDFKLPEAKKEMITNIYVTPIIQETVTKFFMEKGRITKKDVTADGNEPVNKVLVTKNTYNSWASVIKSKADTVIKYEQIDEK
jgi:hypothetical protein